MNVATSVVRDRIGCFIVEESFVGQIVLRTLMVSDQTAQGVSPSTPCFPAICDCINVSFIKSGHKNLISLALKMSSLISLLIKFCRNYKSVKTISIHNASLGTTSFLVLLQSVCPSVEGSEFYPLAGTYQSP